MTDRSALYAVLDAGLMCHLAFAVDGAPVVLPTGYGRDGDTLYVHGSTGAASLRAAAAGAQVCVNVTLLDGIVYSRAVFHHSVNYRSATVHGAARAAHRPRREARAPCAVITDHLAPGSWDHAREPTQAGARQDRRAGAGPRRGRGQDPHRPARGGPGRPDARAQRRRVGRGAAAAPDLGRAAALPGAAGRLGGAGTRRPRARPRSLRRPGTAPRRRASSAPRGRRGC